MGHVFGLARHSAVTPARRSRRRGSRASSTKKKLPPAGDVNLIGEGTPLRDIERLIAVDDSAWSHLPQALAESDALTLPVDPERGRRSLGGVYGATAWGIDALGEEWEFDLLVIDEAAQCSLAFTLAAAGRAKRILLLGDPRQLPQVVQGTHWGGAESSALGWWANNEAALPADRGYFMEQTWRMPRNLTTKVSALPYRNQLVSADAANERYLSVAVPCTYPVESGIHGVRLKREGNSIKSQEEVDEVVRTARELLSGGTVWHTPSADREDREVTQRDVLVVAPYDAQVTSLRAALKAVVLAEVRVGTVDKFQGQEAPIVIVSMTCSSAADSPRGADSVMNRNRLNVAVSPAQWVPYVVCSEHLVEVTPVTFIHRSSPEDLVAGPGMAFLPCH